MKWLKIIFGITFLLVLMACDNATPEFNNLGDVPQPTFSGKITLQTSTSSSSYNIPINGECHASIETLRFQVNGYNSWGEADQVANGTTTIDCKNTQSFSFNLLSLSEMAAWDLSSAQTIKLEVRGLSKKGVSETSRFIITYQPSNKFSPFRISSGGGFSSSTTHKMKASTNFINSDIKSSASHIMAR